jgi:cytochrome P450
MEHKHHKHLTLGKPPKDPIFGLVTGHILTLRKARLDFMLDSMKEFGDFVEMKLLHKTTYILTDPDAVGWVLKYNANNYPKNTPGYKKVSTVIGDGVFTEVGDSWKKIRKVLQPFFNPKKFDFYNKTINEVAKDSIQNLKLKNDETLNISHFATEYTLQVLGKIFFSEDLGQEVLKIYKHLSILIEITENQLTEFFPLPFGKSKQRRKDFKISLEILDALITELINNAKLKKNDQNNLIHALVNGCPHESDKFLLDQVKTLAFAGHETSANVISWCFYYFGKEPKQLEVLREEIKEFSKKDWIDHVDIQSLPKLGNYINEVMRLRPPAWSFGRLCVGEDKIHGQKVKPGTLITISPYLMHHNERLWKAPYSFNPTRFETDNIHPFAFIPFGAGQRVCIGDKVAILEIKLLLANFIHNFEFEILNTKEIKVEPLIALRPSAPIKLKFL